MKPVDMQLAIAEACDISRPTCDRIGGCLHDLNPAYRCKCDDEYRALIPDYLNDLNAMAGAEKVLNDEEYARYALWLGPLTNQRVRSYISATALQRAEAFLRVKGLWKTLDTPPQDR